MARSKTLTDSDSHGRLTLICFCCLVGTGASQCALCRPGKYLDSLGLFSRACRFGFYVIFHNMNHRFLPMIPPVHSQFCAFRLLVQCSKDLSLCNIMGCRRSQSVFCFWSYTLCHCLHWFASINFPPGDTTCMSCTAGSFSSSEGKFLQTMLLSDSKTILRMLAKTILRMWALRIMLLRVLLMQARHPAARARQGHTLQHLVCLQPEWVLAPSRVRFQVKIGLPALEVMDMLAWLFFRIPFFLRGWIYIAALHQVALPPTCRQTFSRQGVWLRV